MTDQTYLTRLPFPVGDSTTRYWRSDKQAKLKSW